MGRNKKIHDLYSCTLKFRLSDSQYSFFTKYCSNLNMSFSTYLRKHIESLMCSSGNFVLDYLSSCLNDSSFDEKDKFYIKKVVEVFQKRKVG